MKRLLKRALIVLAGLVLITGLGVGALFGITFMGNAELHDREQLAGFGEVVRDGFVSTALLDMGDGKLALIDAGNDLEARPVLAALARRHKSVRDLDAVFLTHGHKDHIGGLYTLRGPRVYALASESALVSGRRQSHAPLSRFIKGSRTWLDVSHPLSDGDAITIGARTVRVFAIPGHTRGSAAYYVDGLLFLGDSADASDEGELTPAKWLFSDDTHANRASLARLAKRLEAEKLPVKQLVFAHTAPLSGLDPLLRFAKRTGT